LVPWADTFSDSPAQAARRTRYCRAIGVEGCIAAAPHAAETSRVNAGEGKAQPTEPKGKGRPILD